MRKIHNVRCVYTILPAVFFVCTLVHCEPLFFPILIQSFYLVRHILFHFRINIPRNDFQSCTFRPGNVWNIKDYISKQINAEQKINTEEKDPKQRLLAAFYPPVRIDQQRPNATARPVIFTVCETYPAIPSSRYPPPSHIKNNVYSVSKTSIIMPTAM